MSARSEGTVLLDGHGGAAERGRRPWLAALIVLGVVAASALGGYVLASATKSKAVVSAGSVQALPALAGAPTVTGVRPLGALPALARPRPAKHAARPKATPAPVIVAPTPRPAPPVVHKRPHPGGTVTVISEPQ